MKKELSLLFSVCALLFGCGKDEEADISSDDSIVATDEQKLNKINTIAQKKDKWSKIAGNPELFLKEYNKFTSVQKYYFCSAFSMGAMSASKPATASAMVSYFLGLGVEKYGQGIDDNNYYAFDMGKNIFRYELVVNYRKCNARSNRLCKRQ